MLHPSAHSRFFVLVFTRLWLHENGMHRRRFIASIGSVIALPCVAAAQKKPMPLIGYLNPTSEGLGRGLAAFRQGLSEAGFVEGQNVAIEYRWARGEYDRLSSLAADLVARSVTVIFSDSVTSTFAARRPLRPSRSSSLSASIR